MKFASLIIAATAAAAAPLSAQTTAPAAQPGIADLSTAMPVAGRWTYIAVTGGSEADFVDSANRPQITLRCTRGSRAISLSRPATGAAPFLQVWTSSLTRNLPASYTPATARLTATLAAYDPVFDALAMSRGRIGVAVSGQPPLVVPPWGEVGRIIEDCRV